MTDSAASDLLDKQSMALFSKAKAARDIVSSACAGESVNGDDELLVATPLTVAAPQLHPSESFDSEQQYQLYKKIKNAAMDLLARREYSFGELVERLCKRFVTGDDERSSEQPLIQMALETLQQDGLQSDYRFVESFINSRVNRSHGLRRIQQDLYPKRVSSQLVEEIFSVLNIDWFASASDCYQRKYGDSAVTDYKEYGKRVRFMAYRGHDMSNVNELLSNYKKF